MRSDPRDLLPHYRGSYQCGWCENPTPDADIFTAWIRDLKTGRARAVWGCLDHIPREIEAALLNLRPPKDL